MLQSLHVLHVPHVLQVSHVLHVQYTCSDNAINLSHFRIESNATFPQKISKSFILCFCFETVHRNIGRILRLPPIPHIAQRQRH